MLYLNVADSLAQHLLGKELFRTNLGIEFSLSEVVRSSSCDWGHFSVRQTCGLFLIQKVGNYAGKGLNCLCSLILKERFLCRASCHIFTLEDDLDAGITALAFRKVENHP